MKPVRVLVLGGSGNFGARIVRALQGDSTVELLAASRRGAPVPGMDAVRLVALDMEAPDFWARLTALNPGLVIHCVGPFQGQDYRVVQAALASGAHYLDLTDGRDFVARFFAANDSAARAADRIALSGASTLPALSSAVIDALREPLPMVDRIELAIAPGQRAPRGVATLAGVFSYLGQPIPVWRNRQWQTVWGWMDLRRLRLDIGNRWAAVCDVPDLALLPERYPGVSDVEFHAALEFGTALCAVLSGGSSSLGFAVARGTYGVRTE
jgi:saccharopine dehydrogenase-like NADP-dependent oxidoreductase